MNNVFDSVMYSDSFVQSAMENKTFNADADPIDDIEIIPAYGLLESKEMMELDEFISKAVAMSDEDFEKEMRL